MQTKCENYVHRIACNKSDSHLLVGDDNLDLVAQDGASSCSDVSDFTGEDGIKCLGKSSEPTVSL